MQLHTRSLVEEDYSDTLVPWWTSHDFTPPVQDFLPDNGKGGIIVYEGETPVCAGFLYETNSAVAWSEWVISDKEYRNSKGRKACISLLLNSLEEMAIDKGFRYIFANNNNKFLVEHYKTNGYSVGCTDSIELIKII